MHRRHDPTYYWATRRLPSAIRPATHALYAYVRMADEIVDGARRPWTGPERRAALNDWERQLVDGLARGNSDVPVVAALVDAGRRHALPLEELRTYMDSMRVDCGPVDIGTWPELERYMDGSAGSVGRIMAALLDVPERHRADFGRLGRAFQLTNFIRDVREDRALGRVYLPAEDRERFGVTEADLDRGTAGTPMRALMAFEVQRARAEFAACSGAVGAAPASVRPGIKIALAVYGRVLDRVEAIGFDVLGRRTAPSPFSFATAAAVALAAR